LICNLPSFRRTSIFHTWLLMLVVLNTWTWSWPVPNLRV
jgi:hypothetical protein